jgi:hypothetical protein
LLPASKRDYLGDDHRTVFLLDLLPTLKLEPILAAMEIMEKLEARDPRQPRKAARGRSSTQETGLAGAAPANLRGAPL